MPRYGAIEAGGTKFICATGTGPHDLTSTRIPTRSPAETIPEVANWLRTQGPLEAIGIGSFGPVELNRASPLYGHITNTPKTEWGNCNLAGTISDALNVPVAFDTDVNAAMLGESKWGAAQGTGNAIYLTIGTGIGGGAIINNRILHGANHPEMGHMRIPHDLALDPFPGICPFHGDCLEGLASGPAIHARGKQPPDWNLEARYLALGLANLTCTLAPDLIIMGGGVMTGGAISQNDLFDLIRHELAGLLAGYMRVPQVMPPALGANSGVLGAIALAQSIRAE